MQPLQEESGPSETGTQSLVRDKFDPLGVHFLFLLSISCNVASRVKTSALLTSDN